MTTTITRASDSATTVPDLVLGYESRRSSRSVVHDLIGGGIAVTLVEPRLRSGKLELFYPDEADAWVSFNLHGVADVFTVGSDDVPDIDMAYVVDGDVSIALDDQTRAVWVVSVGYQEVEL